MCKVCPCASVCMYVTSLVDSCRVFTSMCMSFQSRLWVLSFLRPEGRNCCTDWKWGTRCSGTSCEESKRFVSGVWGIIHNDGGFVNTEFVGNVLEGGERNSGPAANMGHNWLTTTKTNNWQVKWIHSLSLCNAAFSWKTLYFKILVNVTFTGVYPPNISLAPSNGSILLLQDSASCHSTKLFWTLNLHKSNSSDPNLNIHEGARIDHPRWTHQQDQRAHVHALMGQNWTVYKWWM